MSKYIKGSNQFKKHRKPRHYFAKFLMICFGLMFLYGVFSYISPAKIKYERQEVIKEIPLRAPVMDRIADCESGKRLPNGKAVSGSATHFGKSGQVIMTGNENKSVDVGKYAINSVWFSKATELGLNITREEDNKKMAQWIYENRGTDDWGASRSCWK